MSTAAIVDASKKERPLTFLRELALPLLVFAAWPIPSELFNRILWTPRGFWWSTVIAWRLTPWSKYSIPFDASVFDGSGYAETSDEILSTLPAILSAALLMSVVLLAIHGCLFVILVAIYRRFGSPPYFRDLREKIQLLWIWRKSVLHSWWVIPVFALISQTWAWLSVGQAYVQYQTWNTDWPFSVAMVLVVVVTLMRIASTRLVFAVQSALTPDDRRCLRCNYHLRGLTRTFCPECGTTIPQEWPPQFSLLRKHSMRLARRLAWSSTLLLIITAPAWEPMIVSTLPTTWQLQLPATLKKAVQIWRPTIECPVRPGSFCILRRDNETCVFYIPKSDRQTVDMKWWYWKEADLLKQQKADEDGVITLFRRGAGPYSLGGCSVNLWWTEFQYQWWIWVSFTKNNWDADVFSEETAPPYLSTLMK